MSRFLSSILLTLVLLHSSFSAAEQMDARLNMAKRSLSQIETKLAGIRPGDVAQYNRLSAQLTKVASSLKATESKTHPDYAKSVQKWSRLQQSMVDTAQQWQNQQSQQSQTKPKESIAKTTPTPNQNSSMAALPKSAQTIGTSASDINPEQILAKYQSQNRPKLGSYPNPSDVEIWALAMQRLQTTELQSDLVLLEQIGSAKDVNRVKRWIGGEFQQQITQAVKAALNKFNGEAITAVQLAEQIQGIRNEDKMRVYNFAHGQNGRLNAQTIQKGLVASANAMSIEGVYPTFAVPQRQQQISMLAQAQQRLQAMTESSANTATELAKLPTKQKATKKEFLKGIAQQLWYRGRVLASLDKKGSVWMNNTDVGDIESDGTIWVKGNDLGSIELDGKVWFRGQHIGSLEDNGKVWRNGTQVGTIEAGGKVWVDGNANGDIVPFEGEWKRAAIIYYFRDIFSG